MRFVLILLAAVTAAIGLSPAAHAQTPMPDLSGYTEVSAYPYASGDEAYFQTPDGLLCAIQPSRGVAGCDGKLPAALIGANQIVLSDDVQVRGLRATSTPRFVKPTGGAAPVLHDGQKLSLGDIECAVGPGARTACTKGTPATQWFVVSPSRTGVGPATDGLPQGFPDPNDFVVGDDTYLVGSGAKNLFPVFTVEGGLTCSIAVFSGGSIGCDGPLPRVTGGENEVFTDLPGATGIRRTDQPKFSTPAYPGVIRQLPVGYRVHGTGATCMAITGGVACYGTLDGRVQGFVVSPEGTETFG
ncbi:hypothetical protein [Mycolicibacterium grossiae]|uniref:Secreted protein n=1 Tax=Mycolicibacterium grossiae TaxID=1552759 RepID=A0A1E8Q106_9MYCO|nr:hypothetical protein [Mycolicibacterium grossiae]OFJ52193.1 hypothetical protein BEL07_18635 [Mycolicibacterium grossiae]QEM46682.1 hypothetical protein FZ046_19610 [Mycolicibacterium grossiae]